MFEVELQLGATDETHIIRTIEYWANEKRKWPKRSHTAVLVAEQITNRFFNVVHLLRQLEEWLNRQGKAMGLLTRQIDELESNRNRLGLGVVSKHAVKTVAGNVVWESFKWIGRIFMEVLSKGSVTFPS